MQKEDYWNALLDILINVGRQTDKDKIGLCENSIGPKEPETILPFSLWTYHQSWGVIWKVNASQVYDTTFKSKIDDKYYNLGTGLKIIIEEYTQESTLVKMNENIWSLEQIFPVEESEGDCWQKKQGWLYENHEGMMEIIEMILLNNLFISEEMAMHIFKLQKDFIEKEEAAFQDLQKQIEDMKRRNSAQGS